jgi:DNA (cytosine-5)-methyltransferase 1
MRKRLNGIRCVDLFCGAGGLSYGFSLEGLPVAAGIDLDPACKYPYEANNCDPISAGLTWATLG